MHELPFPDFRLHKIRSVCHEIPDEIQRILYLLRFRSFRYRTEKPGEKRTQENRSIRVRVSAVFLFDLKSMKGSAILLSVACLLYLASGCAPIEPKSVEQKYDLAIQQMDKGNYSVAIPLLDQIIQESPGTRYAIYSYLKKGDALMEGGSKFDEAETNYRIFLNYSTHSHLIPYVLTRLIELNYRKERSLLFGSQYNFARDPERFKKVIAEYQRFYLMYPHSLYLKDSQKYLDLSVEALAEHELIIGDWYYDHLLYTAAIARYSYILGTYPNFKKRDRVVRKLIDTYRLNQQPELAEEMESAIGKPM